MPRVPYYFKVEDRDIHNITLTGNWTQVKLQRGGSKQLVSRYVTTEPLCSWLSSEFVQVSLFYWFYLVDHDCVNVYIIISRPEGVKHYYYDVSHITWAPLCNQQNYLNGSIVMVVLSWCIVMLTRWLVLSSVRKIDV